MVLVWRKELQRKLIQQYGDRKGRLLDQQYGEGFSSSYRDDYTTDQAVSDIGYMEQLSREKPLTLDFYRLPVKSAYPLRLRLFQWQQPIPLSNAIPMLENLELSALNEHQHQITLQNEQAVWVTDFAVQYKAIVDIARIAKTFQEAFSQIYLGRAENDGFNKLILSASLSWHEVIIVRAYAKYLHQARFRFSQAYIEQALNDHPDITRDLIELFKMKHCPLKKANRQTVMQLVEKRITQALNTVSSLDQDKVIRCLWDLIRATVRTNYFQLIDQTQPKTYLTFKFRSRDIPILPLPVPLYEIFVYSPRFEAIHLRHTQVARGGIRWSDRREDFRTEILGLMKAQTVKNAIIVPSGSKGGFVLKAVPSHATRDRLQEEVVDCYKLFMRGLLELTDNIVKKKVVHPKHVVCYDEPDPYLVVAADKGTATFSDVANQIAQECGFWLGDAFASGGITGYDHKKIGITARGAWESIKRHFRELDRDITQTTLTVVGIGDMSGDVFGNGLIYSEQIKLIGAFDHRHVFIDPDPHPETSFKERLRLFHLPLSSWEDYNPKCISTGGGVFKRSAKSITLTPQMKKVLGINDQALAPNELIRALLKAPVDLLFNGGIGTYVKASTESHADVGDRANDYCRINGEELRCKVVGEGGNLGFTQLGRVEYALKGGFINTDFIDNSAGVDCSDHEVNLKILLAHEVNKGSLSEKKRNQLLSAVTDEIAQRVLKDNYYQAWVMSFAAFHVVHNGGLYQAYLKELEAQNVLNREVEYLPSDKELLERKAAGQGLTRPELALLLAYTKIHIKHEILKTDLPEDDVLSQIVATAFPSTLAKKYKKALREHRLYREIVATQLSNYIVNQMGITFIYRLQVETGATVADIVRAQAIATHIFDSMALRPLVEALDFKISMTTQYEVLYNIRQLINLATRWFLRSPHLHEDLTKVMNHFAVRVKQVEDIIPTLVAGSTKHYLEALTTQFLQAGLSKQLAKRIAVYRATYTALNIIEVSTNQRVDLIQTARIYFAAGERFNLLWFRDQIANDARDGHWNVLARLTLRDELDIAQRALTVAILNQDKKEMNVTTLIEKWSHYHRPALKRWDELLSMLHGSTSIDYAMFFIAMRELLGLIQVHA